MKPMVNNINKYIKVYWLISKSAIVSALDSRYGAVLFILGKIVRISTFTYFMYVLVTHSNSLMGYSAKQLIFFLLTFNIGDTGSQFLFRDVYRFRSRVINGEIDGYFIKPINVLARSLLGGLDVMDFIVFVPLVITTIMLIPQVINSGLSLFLYLVLLVNSFVISTAFHIFILGMGIATNEVELAVFIYRDLTSLGKIPLDVYKYPINTIFSYIIPIGIMMTFPAKALFGQVSILFTMLYLAFGIMLYIISLKYWDFAVKKYSSASS